MIPNSKTAVAVSVTTAAAGFVCLLWRRRCRRSKCPPFPPLDSTDSKKDPLKRGIKKTILPKQADVVVIGSGPSGLSTACFLSARGYKVLVLEQHDRAGGGLHSFVEKGKYEFDTGFHYTGEVGIGQPLRKIVDWLTSSQCDWTPIGDCKVAPGIYDQVHFLHEVYTNGSKLKPFDVPAEKEGWVQALKEAFPDESKAIDQYIYEMDTCAKTGLAYAIWRSLPSKSWLSFITKPFLANPMIHYNQQLSSTRINQLFKNERLKAIIGYVSLGCIGIPPEQLNYSVMLGLHSHFSSAGAFYPKNGPSSVAAAMVERIEAAGGRVLVRAGVDRVLVEQTSNKKLETVGVQLVKEGLVVKAPIVISSVGLRETVHGLLRTPNDAGPALINSGYSGTRNDTGTDPLLPQNRQQLSLLLDELPQGHGHIFGFVGIKHNPGEALNIPRRNVWFLPSYNLCGGVDNFQRDPKQQAPFGYVGLAFPSQKDPSYKVRFSEGVITAAFVAGDVPWEWVQEWADTRVHKRGEEYEKFKENFKQRLLDLMYMKYPQTKGKVDFVDLGTPVDTRTYLGRLTGASYGIPPTVSKAKADIDWLRPSMPELLPEGVYLAGQDVTCDGFAPAVLSGLMVTAAVDGVFSWLGVVPMLGGVIETLKVL